MKQKQGNYCPQAFVKMNEFFGHAVKTHVLNDILSCRTVCVNDLSKQGVDLCLLTEELQQLFWTEAMFSVHL